MDSAGQFVDMNAVNNVFNQLTAMSWIHDLTSYVAAFVVMSLALGSFLSAVRK